MNEIQNLLPVMDSLFPLTKSFEGKVDFRIKGSTHYIKHKVKTHATTNLNAQELEDRYGNRVRSRMRELLNLVAFGMGSKDKRI